MSELVTPLDQLSRLLPLKGRLMGLDLGTKTIGLALSDVERRLASPLETIKRIKFSQDAHLLLKIAEDQEAMALIFGLPLNMDGSSGPRAQATEAFLRNLRLLTSLPFALWDERLSTAAVTRDLIDQDVSRAKRAQVVDKLAAAYILQGALDRLNGIKLRSDPNECIL